MSLRVAARIEAEDLSGPDLWRRLTRLRFGIQGIGMVAIFVTAMWGMWQNLNIPWK